MKQIVSMDVDNSDTESFEEISESDLQELQAQRSPVSDNSDTLTYTSLNSNEAENTANALKGQMTEFLDRYNTGLCCF